MRLFIIQIIGYLEFVRNVTNNKISVTLTAGLQPAAATPVISSSFQAAQQRGRLGRGQWIVQFRHYDNISNGTKTWRNGNGHTV